MLNVTEIFKNKNLENSPWIIIIELRGFFFLVVFFFKAVIKYANNNLTYLDIISLTYLEMPFVLISEPVLDLNYTNKSNPWGQRWVSL